MVGEFAPQAFKWDDPLPAEFGFGPCNGKNHYHEAGIGNPIHGGAE